MLLGMIILSHRYPIGKYMSVLLITSGLLMCTFEDYQLKAKAIKSPTSDLNATDPLANKSQAPILVYQQSADLFSQTIGILFLTVSLIFSSGTGIYQEVLRNRYGKHPDESLFYVVC